MDKEFLKTLIEFAEEYGIMHLPVTRVITLYDEFIDDAVARYIESYCNLN